MFGRVSSALRRLRERAGTGRRLVAVVCSVAVSALVTALVVTGSGYPVQKAHLLSGSAWLPSSRVGQLTLLDGSSVEVAAQVEVAAAGDILDVVQEGSTGYAVDRTAGTIRRVDGATFQVTSPAVPIPGATDGLQAFASSDTLYVLDTGHGVLAAADPRTLATRGALLPLAAAVTPRAATLDETGRLWVLDSHTGDLIWAHDGRRDGHRGAAQPNAGMLTLAAGSPVLIDTTSRTATTLDPRSGVTDHTTGLDLRPNEKVQVSGSPHTQRLYVVASRGVLMVCDLTAANCGNAVPLAASGVDLGAAVEAGNRLFVPDYTAGRVWIVDLGQSKVVAQPQVISPQTHFQLLTRDGVVFFNDPASERAGVIRLDGGVRKVAKYDRNNPVKGLTTTPPGNGLPPAATPPTGTPPTATPSPAASLPTGPSPTRVPPLNPPTSPPSPPPTGPRPTPTPSQPASLQIVVSKSSAQVGEDVTMKVTADAGAAPVSAHWSFGDGQAADGLTTSHHWTAPQTYQVSVQATFPDGHTATASRPIRVTTPTSARFQLTVTTPTDGSVTGNGIGCPPTCSNIFDQGQSVTLTASPATYFAFAGWAGACTGPSTTCTLTMSADMTVSATFRDTAEPEDCVSHDPAQLTIVNIGAQGYRLVDSGTHWMAVLDTQQDAQNALSVARGFTQHCFVGRGTKYLMEYWKGGAGQAGPVAPEDCIPYNPNNLSIVQVNDASGTWWSLRDGSMWMQAFTSESQAVRGLRVEQQHTQQCFIGRDNQRPNRRDYILEYWR